MIAFVLSGGGSRGALQVGALEVLIGAGLVPDMTVGVSVGAINGAWIASDPSLAGIQELVHIWSLVRREDLYPGNQLTALWAMLRGREALFSNTSWYRFLKSHAPCETFSSFGNVRCYVAATELASGKLHVFGDDPDGSLVDALMASCALPPWHPPYRINGTAYIDGGASANLPLRVALERGARHIYALNILNSSCEDELHNCLDISNRALAAVLQRQTDQDLEYCGSCPDVTVRQIDLIYDGEIPIWDFSRTDELIELGREAARAALAREPLAATSWQERLLSSIAGTASQWGGLLSPKETVEDRVIIRG